MNPVLSLIDRLLPGLTAGLRDRLLHALRDQGAAILAGLAAQKYGRQAKKQVDAIVAGLAVLPAEQATDGITRYVADVRAKATAVGNAVEAYAPAQAAVAVAEQQHGKTSTEAGAARAARKPLADALTAALKEMGGG